MTTLVGYGLAIVMAGLGLALGGGARHWLISAAVVMLAVGLTAGLCVRIVLLYLDPDLRRITWTQASMAMRVFRVVALLARAVAAIVLVYVAVGSVKSF